MIQKKQATIEDLYAAPGKAELIGGEVVLMSPAGRLHGYIAGEIYSSIRAYCRRTGLGVAAIDSVGFVVELPNRQSFSPDAAFYTESIEDSFGDRAPLFAVEVRSPSEYGPAAELKIDAKRSDYFAAGTLGVWDVDPRGSDVVRVYRASSPVEPKIYRRGEIAEAEPAMPGWTMAVDDMFPR